MQVCRLKKHRLLYSLPVILFFYFLAVQYDTKTPRDIQTNIEVEIFSFFYSVVLLILNSLLKQR